MKRDEVVRAGLIAAAASGIPSTTWTLARGGDLLEGARAAGTLLAPRARSTPALLAAAVPVHLGLSLGWAAVLAALLPRGREPLYGPLAGLAIAALDLEVIGRRFPAIRALPQPPQWADHFAYGLAVGIALRCHRSSRECASRAPRTGTEIACQAPARPARSPVRRTRTTT